MSDELQPNQLPQLPLEMVRRLQEQQLTKEGYVKRSCRACNGTGHVPYDGTYRKCPSCNGAGAKWAPGAGGVL